MGIANFESRFTSSKIVRMLKSPSLILLIGNNSAFHRLDLLLNLKLN